MGTTTVEVWVLVDAAGDSAVGASPEDCRASYEENIQALNDAEAFRMVKVSLVVPPPAVAELSGTVAEDGKVATLVTG